jgi:hypothetical protein
MTVIARQGALIRIASLWKVMSLFAYRGPPTRPGTGRAQVRWSSEDVALEKMVLGELRVEGSVIFSMNKEMDGAIDG